MAPPFDGAADAGGPWASVWHGSAGRVRVVLHPAVLAALAASVVSVLPIYLVGAMAVQLRVDLELTASQVGAAALWYFLAAAVGSLRAGRMVEAVGARVGLMCAGLMTAAAMVGVAASGQVWSVALSFLAVAGVANAVAQPAANLMLARVLPPSHRGLGFGIKQSAIPSATLLGGLFVPVFALTVGWRWGFMFGAVLSLGAVVVVGRHGAECRPEQTASAPIRSDVPLRPLLVMGVAAGLGSATAVALGTFYVGSTVAAGFSPTWAGLLFAAGSLVGIVVRIGLGLLADLRPSRHLLRVSAMFAASGAGFLLLTLQWPATVLLGTAVAFGAGMGWQGLFVHSLVRQSPNTPAFTTGVVQILVSLGSALGPPLLGAVVDGASYAVGWMVAAVMAVAACLILLVGRRMALAGRTAQDSASPSAAEDGPSARASAVTGTSPRLKRGP
jgi:MFS family permease